MDTLEPVLTLGAALDESGALPGAFGRVNSVVLDDDGNVYVADGIALAVSVFDADGRFIRSIGRSGGGPGEFGELYSLTFLGDSLLALDPRNARVTVFSRAGEPLGTWRWLPLTGPVSHVRFHPTAPREVYVLGVRRQQGPMQSAHIRLTPTGPADTVLHLAPEAPPGAMLQCPRPDRGISFFSVPFANRVIAVPAPGRQLAFAAAGNYRVMFRNGAGDTTFIVERDYQPLPVLGEQWDAATEDFRQFQREWPGVTCTPSDMERPSHRAALQGIYFGHDGELVVEVTADRMTRYDFYAADGRALETAIVPLRDAGVAPYFRGRHFVQVEKDSLDVQRVSVYQREDGVSDGAAPVRGSQEDDV